MRAAAPARASALGACGSGVASSPSRSVKKRRAPGPAGNGAASRRIANDMPALQSGFEGPGGQARGALAEVRHGAHETDREIDRERLLGRRPRHRVRIREQAQHQRVRRVREIDGDGSFLVLDPHAARRPHRRRCTGLVAAGKAGENCGFAPRSCASSSRIARNFW